MTTKEMTEIFSVMLLAWPNAEVFKGGIAKLKPTIKLWTGCTADEDYWTGQQAVIRLCKTNKFPPTIAEFREQVEVVRSKIRELTQNAFQWVRNSEMLYGSLETAYGQLGDGELAKLAIDSMGGIGELLLYYEHNGETLSHWNYTGFEKACETIIRGLPTLVGGKPPALPTINT